VARTVPFDVTWTVARAAPSQLEVVISCNDTASTDPSERRTDSRLVCTAAVDAGTLSIPVEALGRLPADGPAAVLFREEKGEYTAERLFSQ